MTNEFKMSRFKWDGTDLGELKDDQILSRVFADGDEYWTISLDDTSTTTCYVRSIVTNHANLIDELKPVFNLTKLGTHRAQYKARKILLIKPVIEDGKVVCDSEVDFKTNLIDQVFVYQMQELYVFREMLGISLSYDRHIRVRKGGVQPFQDSQSENRIRVYPISFHENTFHPEKSEKVLPNTVIEKWFGSTPIEVVARRLLGISNTQEIPSCLFRLNSQIQDVVERVDRDLCRYVTSILDRVKSRLMYPA